MIVRTPQLEALELRREREAYPDLTYAEALTRFGALWAEALALHDDPLPDWRRDVRSDMAIARAVNGLPPS